MSKTRITWIIGGIIALPGLIPIIRSEATPTSGNETDPSTWVPVWWFAEGLVWIFAIGTITTITAIIMHMVENRRSKKVAPAYHG